MNGRGKAALRILLAACLLSATVATTAATTDMRATEASDDEWRELESDHFVIKYKPGYERSAETVLDHLEVIQGRAAEFFPDAYDSDRPLPVYVHPESEWDRGPGSLYWTTRGGVHVNLLAPEDSPRNDAFHRHGLAHEYANIVMYDYTGDENGGKHHRYHRWAPSWFGEGISEYFAIQIALEPDQRAQYETAREVEELRARIRDDRGHFVSIAQNQYEGGYLLSKYMFDTYERDAVFSVLTSHEEYFYDAVSAKLDVSGPAFRSGWLDWAETNVGGSYPDATSVEAVREQRHLEERLSEQNETVDALRARLAEKNRTIESLRSKLADKRNQTEALRDRLERTNRTAESSREADARSMETATARTDDERTSTRTSVPGFTAGLGFVAWAMAVLLVAQRRTDR